MDFKTLIQKICEHGRASVRKHETGPRLNGALRGFEVVATAESPEHLYQLLLDERDTERSYMEMYHKETISLDTYWEQRYCTLQIEWALEVLNVGIRLKSTVSTRALRAYAEIVGVKE